MNDDEGHTQPLPRTSLSRKLAEWAFFIVTMSALILVLDWHDYHTKGGKALLWSWLYGSNPRCIAAFGDSCAKLDPHNLPIGPILATWVGWLFLGSIVVACVGLAVIAPIGLFARVVMFPAGRSSSLLSRLAHSGNWLLFGSLGVGMLISAGIFFIVGDWGRMPFTSLFALIATQALSYWAAMRIDAWAMTYRHAEADAYWERERATYRALDEASDDDG